MNRPELSADEQAIRQLISDWHQATAEGALERILPLMADDVVFLVAGQAPFGRAEFAQRLSALFQTHRIESSGNIQELQISGDIAYCWSQLEVRVYALDGGTPMQRAGPVLSVLRKHDCRWQITRDANLLS